MPREAIAPCSTVTTVDTLMNELQGVTSPDVTHDRSMISWRIAWHRDAEQTTLTSLCGVPDNESWHSPINGSNQLVMKPAEQGPSLSPTLWHGATTLAPYKLDLITSPMHFGPVLEERMAHDAIEGTSLEHRTSLDPMPFTRIHFVPKIVGASGMLESWAGSDASGRTTLEKDFNGLDQNAIFRMPPRSSIGRLD